MMKKMLALVLALAALTGLLARAETNASVIRLTDLAVAYVDGGNARSVRFNGANMKLVMGASDGLTTAQLTFENGAGQVVDAILQLSGHEILFTMGGLTGVYVLDLDDVAGEGTTGEAIARGINDALALAGSHLDMVLYAVTRDDGSGMRVLEVPLPASQLIAAVEKLLLITEGMQAAEDIDLEGLRDSVERTGDDAVLTLRYNPSTGAIELSAAQNGRGMRLRGRMTLDVEPMSFIEFSPDEERYDVMNLTPEMIAQIQGELGIIFNKFMNFADGTGLDSIMP